MQSDEQLMLDYQKGSAQAFEQLFQRYRNLIYGFFRRRLADPARAEEMAQDTFFVILRDAERYERRAAFRTYIFSIALKMLWSERRKQVREEKLTEAVDPPAGRDPVDNALWIRDALHRLDEGHREVLMLRIRTPFIRRNRSRSLGSCRT
jgi:RNA polymerase sigma factor (sigma-70 family)